MLLVLEVQGSPSIPFLQGEIVRVGVRQLCPHLRFRHLEQCLRQLLYAVNEGQHMNEPLAFIPATWLI